jgi:hypothetical protein
MAAIKAYVSKNILPKDKLLRIRVLEQAQDYGVNQTGLLCRVRERGSRGSLGLDMQVVIPEALRTAVVAGCHEGTEGHSSVIKTYQKVRDRFYWPGMFLDVQKYIKFCPLCNRNTDKRTKAPIKQHVMAGAPGETVVIDLLHYPKAKGCKYLLVAVDAYSRWGELKALQDKYAATVADAIVETILTNTSGGIKLIASDQGSEFKGDVASAMALLKVQQRYTAAYRSEGHGLAERYNRSISNIVRSMAKQSDPDWHKALPWAKLAYNSTVHRALSEGTEGLTPAEVHLGRRMNLVIEKALESQKACEEAKSASAYVQNLAKHVEAMKAWVKQSREKYNARMEIDANKKAKKTVQYTTGDLVSLREERHQGTDKKIKLPYDGPFKVLEATGDNEYTIQRVGEGIRLATDCLFKNSGAANKSRVVSTTNSNSMRSIKTAH